MEWSAIRVQVRGVASFFGLVCCRESAGPRSPIHYGASFIVPRSKRFDLRDHDAVVRLYEEARPPIVIHLKVTVEGIGANRLNPGRFFYDNAMGVQPIECARRFNVQKFVAVGTVCAYPKFTPVPSSEDEWNGYPEEMNAPYGLVKKMLLVQPQGSTASLPRHQESKTMVWF